MSIIRIIFVLILNFSISSVRGFVLNNRRNCRSSVAASENYLNSLFVGLGSSGIPIAVGIYILSAQDKSQKESLSALEKTLSAQDKNQKESLSAQDKSQKESLSALKDIIMKINYIHTQL